MKESLTADTFFNTLALARQSTAKAILVAEGEDDIFLLKAHVNPGEVLLVSGLGKRITLAAARRADELGIARIRFLIDRDYDSFVEPGANYPSNVVTSRHHDLFVDLVVANPEVFDRVVGTHSRRAERRGVAVDVSAVREQSFGLAAKIAPARIVNQRLGLGLRFANYPFGSLETTMPDEEDIVRQLLKRNAPVIAEAYLVAEICADDSCDTVEAIHLVGDHDLFRATTRVLRDFDVVVNPDTLFSSFMAAIHCVQIAATGWFQALVEWGRGNDQQLFGCPCDAPA